MGLRAATRPESKPSRDVVTRLRSDIVSSVFGPETRLKFADLTDRYEVSVGTLREALSQLMSEGFVTLDSGKGFKVAPVSAAELEEIVNHFVDFEARALAESIANGDEEWESSIVAHHHRLSLIEGLPWEERMARHAEWVDRHREFHKSLVSECNGMWLFRLRSLMFDQLDRYRFITKQSSETAGKRKFDEHRKIMEAVIGRDTARATVLLEKHIRDTAARALKFL